MELDMLVLPLTFNVSKFFAFYDDVRLKYFVLFVVDTPRVTAHRSIINTKEGDNAELYCDFESSSESKVFWRKDQKPLPIEGSHSGHRSKYTVIFSEPKSPNKNTSILVISQVSSRDLGEYECTVQNNIGTENVTITLTMAPEPPHLHHTEKEQDEVITHWHIRSLQPLTEVLLNYQLKDVCINAKFLDIWTRNLIILYFFTVETLAFRNTHRS